MALSALSFANAVPVLAVGVLRHEHRQAQVVPAYSAAWSREATVDLDAQGHRRDPGARDDVDHIHLLCRQQSKVSSRIAALIEGTGSDPAPAIIEMAKRLEVGGATSSGDRLQHQAHAYADQVQSATSTLCAT